MPESLIEKHPNIVRAIGIPAGVLSGFLGITILTSNTEQSNPPVLGPDPNTIMTCDYSEYLDVCMEDLYASRQFVSELNNRRYEAELSPLREDQVLGLEANYILHALASLGTNPTLEQHNSLAGEARRVIRDYQGLGEAYSSVTNVSASFDKTQGIAQIPAFDMFFAWQEGALAEMVSSQEIDSLGVAYQDFGEYSIVVAVVANNETSI